MTAYVIYQGVVLDEAAYDQYRVKAGAAVAAAGGHFVVRGGDFEVLEGEPPPARTVIVAFPDRQAALAWYHGAAYTEARGIREHAARARMYVVDGVDEG